MSCLQKPIIIVWGREIVKFYHSLGKFGRRQINKSFSSLFSYFTICMKCKNLFPREKVKKKKKKKKIFQNVVC